MSDQESSARLLSSRPQKSGVGSSLRLFVGGLNKSTSEEVLFQYFSQFGEVRSVEIPRSQDAVSKGFGFVNFANLSLPLDKLLSEARCLEGQSIRVELAHDPADRLAAHESYLARRLYLSGIPSTATTKDIYEAVAEFGIPERITSLRRSNPYSNPNSFYCYVTMDRPQAVQNILHRKFLRCRGGFHILVKPYLNASSKLKNTIESSEKNKLKQAEHAFGQRPDFNFLLNREYCIPQYSPTSATKESNSLTFDSNGLQSSSSYLSSGETLRPNGQAQRLICLRNQGFIRLLSSEINIKQSQTGFETIVGSIFSERNSLQLESQNLRFNVSSWPGIRFPEQTILH